VRGETLTLRVPGMYCPKCEERMALALDHISGVALLRADHVREEIELQLSGDRAPLAEVCRRIEALGFRVELESEPATLRQANAAGKPSYRPRSLAGASSEQPERYDRKRENPRLRSE
jgi:cation transport ATPase